MHYTVSLIRRDKKYTVKYRPLPEGTLEGKRLYLTVEKKCALLYIQNNQVLQMVLYGGVLHTPCRQITHF